MQREKFLLQIYMDDIRRENQLLRIRLAETIIERDKLLKERAELDAAAERIRKKCSKIVQMQFREMVGGPAPKWENPKEEVVKGLGLVVNLESES